MKSQRAGLALRRPEESSPPQRGIRTRRLTSRSLGEILRGKRAITTPTALRMSMALGIDDRFWINI